MRSITFLIMLSMCIGTNAQNSLEQGNKLLITYTRTNAITGSSNKEVVETHVYANQHHSFSVDIPDKNQKNISPSNVIPYDSASQVYKNFSGQYLVFESGFPYLIKGYFNDTLHLMQWQIGEETKKIDSLNCIKATTVFRGRSYTAWFCPDIAISNGPGKFGGLPGLIIELYDSEEYVHFTLKQIKPTDKPISIWGNNYPSYEVFRKKAIAGKKVMEERMRASNTDGNCLNCSTTLSITIVDLENTFLNE